MENNNPREEKAIQWLVSKGIQPVKGNWSFNIQLSTVKMEHWFYSRKSLKPEDTKLDLALRSFGSWVVQLERHDRLFVAQWRVDNRFEVESEQLKYRKIVQWPELKSLDDFPKLVSEIEQALDIKFTRHADVQGLDCKLEPYLNKNSIFFKWLSDCCTSINTNYIEP